uniref:Putative secreted peptide n=1 Tax=Anopheles braziliensis TaxID=58242 RepID=A0A2M3ZRJ6_9DIPT
MRLLVVVVLAIAGFVTVIGSSRDVGTFGLFGTPITAANVSSRFFTIGVVVAVAVADTIDGVGGFGVVDSLMETPGAPSSFPVTTDATVADDDDASLGCLLIRSKVAELLPLGSRPFFDGTSTVDMIGGFVSTAFVSIVVLG